MLSNWTYRLFVPLTCLTLIAGCEDAAPSAQTAAPTTLAAATDEEGKKLPECCVLPEDEGDVEGDAAAQGQAAAPDQAAEPTRSSDLPEPPKAAEGQALSESAEPAQPAGDAEPAASQAADSGDTTAETADVEAAPADARAGAWQSPDQRGEPFYLDFTVTDQGGETFKLQELVGKPMALTFLYTRCPDPTMCPMIAAGIANLQRKVAEHGLTDQVQLVGISYDPTRDTPQLLRTYGEKHNLKYDNAKLLRPQVDEFSELISEFSVDVAPGMDGTIAHRIELLLIDHQGRYVRDYQAAIWDSNEVVADLKRLFEEMPGDESRD